MEYIVSIRIDFPEQVTAILKKEKQDFITKYGGSYNSDPHITLYLSSYALEGFPKLIEDLKRITIKPFTFSLLKPTIIPEDKGRKLCIVDVSNKPELLDLHTQVLEVAAKYRSPHIREKDQQRLEQGLYGEKERYNLEHYGHVRALELFEPHITLGEIPIEAHDPDLHDIEKNLQPVLGEQILVSEIVVYFHKKENSEIKARKLEEVVIPFNI